MTTIWIKAALVRAIKTMAQTAVALIGTNGIGITEVDWVAVLSASALAGVLSLLTSVAGLPEVDVYYEQQDTFNGNGIEVEDYEEENDTTEE